MPTKKPKALKKTVARKTTKRLVRKKTVARKTKRTIKPKIETPTLPEQPVLPSPPPSPPPSAPATTAITMQPRNKSMLWLAVGGVTVIIGMLWLYSLQFTLPRISNSGPTFDEANPQVDEFVDTVENDWSEFQDNVDEFQNLIDSELENSNTNTPQTTNEELENLFSDIN